MGTAAAVEAGRNAVRWSIAAWAVQWVFLSWLAFSWEVALLLGAVGLACAAALGRPDRRVAWAGGPRLSAALVLAPAWFVPAIVGTVYGRFPFLFAFPSSWGMAWENKHTFNLAAHALMALPFAVLPALLTLAVQAELRWSVRVGPAPRPALWSAYGIYAAVAAAILSRPADVPAATALLALAYGAALYVLLRAGGGVAGILAAVPFAVWAVACVAAIGIDQQTLNSPNWTTAIGALLLPAGALWAARGLHRAGASMWTLAAFGLLAAGGLYVAADYMLTWVGLATGGPAWLVAGLNWAGMLYPVWALLAVRFALPSSAGTASRAATA